MTWLRKLIDVMCGEAPGQRVTAQEALEIFEELRLGLSAYDLSQRLHYTTLPEGKLKRRFRDFLYRAKDRWWAMRPPRPLAPLS